MTVAQGKHAPAPASTFSTVGTKRDVSQSIDMRKGLLWQIYTLTHASGDDRLTREQYVRWVHEPYYYKEEPRHMRFFESDTLEVFSKVCVRAMQSPARGFPLVRLRARPWRIGVIGFSLRRKHAHTPPRSIPRDSAHGTPLFLHMSSIDVQLFWTVHRACSRMSACPLPSPARLCSGVF